MASQCLQRLRETTDGHLVEIVAAVDKDPITAERIDPLVDKLLYSGDYRGCSQAWNDCLAEATGDPIVFAADDLIWEPGWLGAALEELSKFKDGWGLVGFNDGHWDAELSTHYLMSRRFIVEVLGGVVAWPWYKHSFNDLEVNRRAVLADRYRWCEDARVYHAHWLYNDRPLDETDKRTLGDHGDAQRIFQEREAAGFPNDYDPVIAA
jgi:glycosyltransferase involved in cell wall biosynthesis